MKAARFACAAVAATALLSGCYTAPVMPPPGLIYGSVRAPMDIDVNETPIANLKSGQTESASVLGLVAWGDASIKTASDNGGLATIEHVDYEFFNVLGVYQRFTTIAYGE